LRERAMHWRSSVGADIFRPVGCFGAQSRG
jgi:hypothetical protein